MLDQCYILFLAFLHVILHELLKSHILIRLHLWVCVGTDHVEEYLASVEYALLVLCVAADDVLQKEALEVLHMSLVLYQDVGHIQDCHFYHLDGLLVSPVLLE